jgi:hypothetical protein
MPACRASSVQFRGNACEVLDWNVDAIAFYESLGATRMPEWQLFRFTGPALERYRGGQAQPEA